MCPNWWREQAGPCGLLKFVLSVWAALAEVALYVRTCHRLTLNPEVQFCLAVGGF